MTWQEDFENFRHSPAMIAIACAGFVLASIVYSMSWLPTIDSFLDSSVLMSMAGGGLALICVGSYVHYKDYSRHRKMMAMYSTGNILPPLAANDYEITYFHRSNQEDVLSKTFRNDFANTFFLVKGECGIGKTRTIIEIVRGMIKNEGSQRKGAPIYVLATQGKSFPESLAKAVNFHFDEHISFKFFLDFVMGIHSFPEKNDESRLTRVLYAIETSSFMYMQKTGRPIVIIIDGADSLPGQMAGALEVIQEKAKLWSDTNTVKLIFVNNDEETEELLQKNSTSWSRAAAPIVMGDMSEDEAIEFLMSPNFLETPIEGYELNAMSRECAEKIFALVGGRIIHLIAFKRDFFFGVSFEVTAEHVKDREREKFLNVLRAPDLWIVVSTLRLAPGKCMTLSKISKATSAADVSTLAKVNIIRYDRDRTGVLVRFQSPLTDWVVDELKHLHEEEEKNSSAS